VVFLGRHTTHERLAKRVQFPSTPGVKVGSRAGRRPIVEMLKLMEIIYKRDQLPREQKSGKPHTGQKRKKKLARQSKAGSEFYLHKRHKSRVRLVDTLGQKKKAENDS